MRWNSSTEAFGQSVSINANGDRVAIGTPSNDDNALSSGKVNFYEFDGNTWQELTDAAKGDMRFDNLGKSLSMNADGNRVVAGANLAGGTQGYTRVYEDSSMRVSVEGYFQDKEIKVYANGQRILLESSEILEQTEIEVLNLQGQRVFYKSASSFYEEEILLNAPAAIYIIYLRHPQGTYWHKLSFLR